jgi:DNA-binding protein
MKRLEEKVKNLTNVENISTGLTRTIAREILSKRGIDIPKGRDALEIFKEKFGQDVLIDVNNLAEELIEMDRMGKKPKSLTQIIEQEGFFDVKMPKEPPQGYTPDELAEIQKEIEQEDILLKLDLILQQVESKQFWLLLVR